MPDPSPSLARNQDQAFIVSLFLQGNSHFDHFIQALDHSIPTARSLTVSALEPYTLQSYKDLSFFQFRVVAPAKDALHTAQTLTVYVIKGLQTPYTSQNAAAAKASSFRVYWHDAFWERHWRLARGNIAALGRDPFEYKTSHYGTLAVTHAFWHPERQDASPTLLYPKRRTDPAEHKRDQALVELHRTLTQLGNTLVSA